MFIQEGYLFRAALDQFFSRAGGCFPDPLPLVPPSRPSGRRAQLERHPGIWCRPIPWRRIVSVRASVRRVVPFQPRKCPGQPPREIMVIRAVCFFDPQALSVARNTQ